jgi:hypothetical protein
LSGVHGNDGDAGRLPCLLDLLLVLLGVRHR